VNEHRFGGSWTEEKLARLRKYLQAYRQIFARNERARFFRTWYVDAFAGTGSRKDRRVDREASLFDDTYEDEDASGYRKGSAKIALGLEEPFDRYLFIEASTQRLKTLRENLTTEYPERAPRCLFQLGDANRILKQWCLERNWKKERAVVFLDPYGMQVDWSTIEALAATKAVDLWYLFPLGVGVMRMLPLKGEIDASWQLRLDSVLGTQSWRDEFFEIDTQMTLELHPLDEPVETKHRTATPAKVEAFIQKRLASCFEGVAKGWVLANSRSSPMYLLCFAAANKRGAPIALKIADQIRSD
jgi:three-Cys-motif partner protein